MRTEQNFRNVILLAFMAFISACSPKTSNQNTQFTTGNNDMQKTEEEWKEILSPEQFRILREKGTERPYTGAFLNHKEEGIYTCGGCGNELFADNMKFDSHCGWPSFDKEIEGGKILKIEDRSHGMIRTEIVCANCGGHLGHLFDDGPTETGLRYCVNSLSMGFKPSNGKNDIDSIVIGGGCFWCVEAVMQRIKGVEKVESGYSGGFIKNPTYKEICTGKTGHAEVLKVWFKPSEISLYTLLEIFMTTHDPTTLNRQGNDVGTQYRSVIFYSKEEQKETGEKIIRDLTQKEIFSQPIVTEVSKLLNYYAAEEYHQDYYNQNSSQPYCAAVISPKLSKLRALHAAYLK